MTISCPKPCDNCSCDTFQRQNCTPYQAYLKQVQQSHPFPFPGPAPAKPLSAANAKQIAGDHYKKYGNLQPWDVVIAWNMGYLDGTALKYLARWKDKGGIDDLKKAIHFIEKLIETTEQQTAETKPPIHGNVFTSNPSYQLEA